MSSQVLEVKKFFLMSGNEKMILTAIEINRIFHEVQMEDNHNFLEDDLIKLATAYAEAGAKKERERVENKPNMLWVGRDSELRKRYTEGGKS